MMSQTPHSVQIDRGAHVHERTSVALFGRCMLANQLEIPCQAVGISLESVELISAHMPKLNEHVIIYLDHVGRLEGDATRINQAGFDMSIVGTDRMREKLAARIEWLKSHSGFAPEDNRRHERIVPNNLNSQLKLADGRTYPIKIIDISLSGAAVASDVKPAIGSMVTLAGMQGKVVRHFAEGIAMEFANLSDQADLASRFGSYHH